ncbi:hypothetical protein PPL_10691 [Heterostelium album PN500]|uniref:Uncharacterized protein n=1 Tax=Heterostelium pallidum (strain ATCC 26659 / Pp 5 / PN500) TaxID=670386 RepID=D3BRT0_HETP5|nr:hypothetical protein PPL_10691 [Heterostelium album PN500]EFA76112.1 hypothetical protein PPL_10691 [Heterostelium album PN500]|eukprot:XP_020428246.1 hypothetical protein PPL_10691 [Heterostelium album PN500]
MMQKSSLKSRYYTAKVTHSRLFPIKHSFLYDIFYFIVDLDELESGQLNSSCFGHNSLRPFSIDDTDYMGKEKRNIKSKRALCYRSSLRLTILLVRHISISHVPPPETNKRLILPSTMSHTSLLPNKTKIFMSVLSIHSMDRTSFASLTFAPALTLESTCCPT